MLKRLAKIWAGIYESDDTGVSERFARARVRQADSLAARVIEIADTVREGKGATLASTSTPLGMALNQRDREAPSTWGAGTAPSEQQRRARINAAGIGASALWPGWRPSRR